MPARRVNVGALRGDQSQTDPADGRIAEGAWTVEDRTLIAVQAAGATVRSTDTKRFRSAFSIFPSLCWRGKPLDVRRVRSAYQDQRAVIIRIHSPQGGECVHRDISWRCPSTHTGIPLPERSLGQQVSGSSDGPCYRWRGHFCSEPCTSTSRVRDERYTARFSRTRARPGTPAAAVAAPAAAATRTCPHFVFCILSTASG